MKYTYIIYSKPIVQLIKIVIHKRYIFNYTHTSITIYINAFIHIQTRIMHTIKKQNIIIIIKTNNEISALPFIHYHHHLR